MTPEPRKTEQYFTEAEVQACQESLRLIKDVGINIYPKSRDSQRTTFFDSAKLWRIIKVIINKMFIDKLISHQLIFVHEDGKKYWLMPIPDEVSDEYKTEL